MSDSISVAAAKIANKKSELLQKRFDIGAPSGDLVQAGYGGYYQGFQNGRIYSHHAVGTYEVHGGILQKFLSRNGVDVNPGMQRREFGFPQSDEFLTPEGYPISRFEWGEIIFFPGTAGGAAISGEIYKAWRNNLSTTYGYPLTSNLRKGRFEYCIFEQGLGIQIIGQPKVYWMRIHFPLIGNPAIVNLANGELPISVSTTKADLAALGGENELIALINEHFALERVSNKASKTKLSVTGLQEQNTPILRNRLILKLGCKVNTALFSRQSQPTLYNLVAKNESGGYSSVSPHCVYHRPSWTSFGLLHATDVHVARRIDHFKNIFREQLAKYPEHKRMIQGGIFNLNNWNNGFRDFIRYANAMHRKGVVDGVMVTGDVVDYLFEHGEFKDGGGNFKFLRDMILGNTPYPDNEHRAEELLVPIFITLGNHDYRVDPFELFQRLDIRLYPDKDIPQYGSSNLIKDEARVLQGGNPGKFDDDDQGRVKVSMDRARKQVVPATVRNFWDKDYLGYYKKYINHSSDFVVSFGVHKLIMIDSGPDVGAPDGNWDRWDAVTTALGFGDAEEVAFQERQNPNCVGPSDYSINNLKAVKATDGVVIVGMHAPPINIFGHEYNHYFRETEHPDADPLETVSFLYRHSRLNFIAQPGPYMPASMAQATAMLKWPDWFNGTTHFKSGSHEEFIHEGVSRKDIALFLKLICGHEGSGKAVDLVLTGHNHRMSEVRVRVSNGKLLYFTDFYTESPGVFHNSKKYKEHYTRSQQVGITITPGASPNGTPQATGNFVRLSIPPYANPLNTVADKAAWWNDHKPLMIQGAPLGPTDHNNRALAAGTPPQPGFTGCKLIVIRNDQIDKIIQVSRNELAKKTYAVPSGVTGVSFGTGGVVDRDRGLDVVLR